MEDFNAPKVPVTMHLTEEAAKILYQYAGERNKGRFVSQLILEQRRRDDLEGEALAVEAKKRAAAKSAESAERARERVFPGGLPTGRSKKKGRR